MATYTGSVTLTNINDGADADSYHLSSNIEGFQKHYEYDQNGNEVVIFSDDIIEFYLEHSVNEQSQPVNPNNYYTSLSTLENGAFYSEYNWTTQQAWLQDYDTLYIKVGNDYKRNVDPEYHSSWTYYVDLLAGINDLWDLFEHINVIDENEIDTTTLLNKVFFKNIDNNSTDFNLHNSLFYPVDENLNLVDGQPSNYFVALRNYRDFVEQQNAYFILKAFQDENLTKIYDYKIFFVEYVINLNFARFALTATNIQASVDNSSMVFDGTGLTIYDGGLTIKQSQQYSPTLDITPQSEKDYYIYEDNQYQKVEVAQFEPGIVYYELIPEADLLKYISETIFQLWEPDETQWGHIWRSLYILEDGEYKLNIDSNYDPETDYYIQLENKRLSIKGSGEFTGTIYATDGVFSGTIAALAGSIGGFTIEDDALISKTRNEITEEEPLSGKKYYVFENNDYKLVDLPKKVTLDIERNLFKDYYLKINDEEYVLYSGEYIETQDIIRQQNKIYYIKDDENQYVAATDNYIQVEGNTRYQNKTYYIQNENGDYIPTDDNYLVTIDTTKQPGKTYYTRNVDGEYIEYTGENFIDGEIYYEFNTELDQSKIYYEFNTDLSQNTYYEFDTELHSGTTYYEDYFASNITYYDDPAVQLLGQQGKIIAKNIDLGTGVNITDYIKLGNSYIYNPLTHNNNFIDIKDINNESIINFRADGTGNIGAIHINGNTSRLNGVNWWISPDKAAFSNIDVTGTIHTSVFETGRIQSVGGSMIFKEGARVSKVTNLPEGLTLTLDTKMGLKPGSIILCTTNDSDYTDTTLVNQLNFYGRVISSVIEKRYIENTDPFYVNVAYYTYDEASGKYIRFVGDGFEEGTTYYILYEGNQEVVVELEPAAAGYESLISQIIQLGDNVYIETEDETPLPNKTYYEYNIITDSFVVHTGNFEIGHTYYEKTEDYTNNLIIGVNATDHINKMLYPEGFTFIKFDNIGDDTINPTFNNTPILFLGNLKGLNNENISGYGLYGENVFLTGSLTTKSGTDSNAKYAGVNTLSGVAANIFTENFFPEGADTSKIVLWAGSEDTKSESIQSAPFQVTENGSFYANHGLFEGSIFVKATIEASELRTASIYGIGNAPALKIYDTNTNKLGIHFYEINEINEVETETLRLTSKGFSNDQGDSYFINIDEFNKVNFNGNNITGDVFYTIPVNNSQLEIIGTNFNIRQYNQENSVNTYDFINFNFNEQFYEIKYDNANRILQSKQNGELTLFSGSTKISTNFSLGGKIDYKQVIEERQEGGETISELIGYDLFVR